MKHVFLRDEEGMEWIASEDNGVIKSCVCLTTGYVSSIDGIIEGIVYEREATKEEIKLLIKSRTMTKKEFARILAENADLSVFDAEKFLSVLGESVKECIESNNDIFIRGFGTIKSVLRKQKTARNISTGESVIVPERKKIVIKFSKDMSL